MKKLFIRAVLALTLFAFSPCAHSYAQSGCVNGGTGACPPGTPEIDPSLAGTGLVLLGGAALLIRARRKQ